MTPNIKTIKELVNETPAMRQAFQRKDAVALVKEQIEVIDFAIKNLRTLLYFLGLYETDFYHCKAKEMAFTAEETKILPRVRWDKRYETPSFFWERLIRKTFPITKIEAEHFKKKPGVYIGFVSFKGKKLRRKVVLSSKAIPLQKATNSIAPSSFAKEPVWAQIAGETAEEKLRFLRKQAKQVTAIAKHLSVLKTQVEKE